MTRISNRPSNPPRRPSLHQLHHRQEAMHQPFINTISSQPTSKKMAPAINVQGTGLPRAGAAPDRSGGSEAASTLTKNTARLVVAPASLLLPTRNTTTSLSAITFVCAREHQARKRRGRKRRSSLASPNIPCGLWLDPVRLAARKLPARRRDGGAARTERSSGSRTRGQAASVPGGRGYPIRVPAVGRLSDPKEFEHIVMKRTTGNGSLIELRDVGRAELGAESYGGRLAITARTPWAWA